MEKLVKLDKLFYIIVGYERSLYYASDIQEIPNLKPLIVRAKYQFFCKGRIKYFVNSTDNTKYYPKERMCNGGICALYYLPVTCIIDKSEIINGNYSKYSTILNGAKQYSEIIEEEIKKRKSAKEKEIEKQNEKKTLIAEENKQEYESDTFGNPITSERKNNLFSKPSFGMTLTDNYYTTEPIVGRKKELDNLIICLADKESNPLLIGPPGVGKTAIVDELAYLIEKNEVPDFLKGKEIIEVDASELVSGTLYRGTLEEKVNNLIDYVVKEKAILFIDHIHTMYGAGETITGNLDIAAMLKHAIDRKNIKIIGISTDKKYEECISKSNLKDNFEPIIVKEPSDNLLYEIICQKFDYYEKTYNISTENIDKSIIDILIELTKPKYRKYDDKKCNPSLVVGIISKSFARVIFRDDPNLSYDDIISSIKENNRIYESARENAIKEIMTLAAQKRNETKSKILKIYQ